MKNIGYIYCITNNINGMIYVGQHCTQQDHLDESYWGSGTYISRAIKKYGKENFSREILEWCSSQDALNVREAYWIDFLNANSQSVGYNLTEGGYSLGVIGYKHTKTTRELLRQQRLDKQWDDATKTKIAASVKRRANSPAGDNMTHRGTHWYTDGVRDVMAKACPAGYHAGRSHCNIRHHDK